MRRDELRGFGGFGERDGRRLAAGHGRRDRVEIARADLALVAGRGIAGGSSSGPQRRSFASCQPSAAML